MQGLFDWGDWFWARRRLIAGGIAVVFFIIALVSLSQAQAAHTRQTAFEHAPACSIGHEHDCVSTIPARVIDATVSGSSYMVDLDIGGGHETLALVNTDEVGNLAPGSHAQVVRYRSSVIGLAQGGVLYPTSIDPQQQMYGALVWLGACLAIAAAAVLVACFGLGNDPRPGWAAPAALALFLPAVVAGYTWTSSYDLQRVVVATAITAAAVVSFAVARWALRRRRHGT